jgi:hypothetical protein
MNRTTYIRRFEPFEINNMDKQNTGWRWREDELTMKEFYELSSTDKDEYILLIEGLKPEERSSMDEILLNRFGRTKKYNYFTLD